MKIAITGASGFIGKNLTLYFHDRGYDVLPLIRNPGKKDEFQEKDLQAQVCDVVDIDSLHHAFTGVDIVIHLAALFNRPECSWDDYHKVNVRGTQNVLEAALRTGVRRVIHCSTIGVALGSDSVQYSEQTPYSAPEGDKYEKTKCEAERLTIEFHKTTGLPIVILRPAQVYGPGDTSKVKFYKMIKNGVMINPGETSKHLIYVDDLSRAFELAITNDKAIGEIFIIGGNQPTSLKDLIHYASAELEVTPPRIMLPATPVGLMASVVESICNLIKVKPPIFRRSMDFFLKTVQCDVTKAKRILAFSSEIDVRDGIAKTVAWYKQKGYLTSIMMAGVFLTLG